MRIVGDFSEIQSNINLVKGFKKGFVTNLFFNDLKAALWIKEQSLFEIIIDETVFYFRKQALFYNLFFISSSIDRLEKSLNALRSVTKDLEIIVDLVGNETVTSLKELFINSGFHEYTHLVRMQRMLHDPEMEYTPLVNLKVASINQLEELTFLFNTYFDPRAEQLPQHEDLIDWINNGSLLIYEVDGQIAGFIIFDLNGKTLYLRYWFVHPEFRERKIGSLLFNFFLYKGRISKRQLFWVINSNENAIKRYKHYGFIEDEMYNIVMINKNIKYERADN